MVYSKACIEKWLPKDMWGVSTIKWTTLDPCTSLSEVIQKIYTNFEFCEKEDDLKHLKNTLIYKASNHVDKKKT